MVLWVQSLIENLDVTDEEAKTNSTNRKCLHYRKSKKRISLLFLSLHIMEIWRC